MEPNHSIFAEKLEKAITTYAKSSTYIVKYHRDVLERLKNLSKEAEKMKAIEELFKDDKLLTQYHKSLKDSLQNENTEAGQKELIAKVLKSYTKADLTPDSAANIAVILTLDQDHLRKAQFKELEEICGDTKRYFTAILDCVNKQSFEAIKDKTRSVSKKILTEAITAKTQEIRNQKIRFAKCAIPEWIKNNGIGKSIEDAIYGLGNEALGKFEENSKDTNEKELKAIISNTILESIFDDSFSNADNPFTFAQQKKLVKEAFESAKDKEEFQKKIVAQFKLRYVNVDDDLGGVDGPVADNGGKVNIYALNEKFYDINRQKNIVLDDLAGVDGNFKALLKKFHFNKISLREYKQSSDNFAKTLDVIKKSINLEGIDIPETCQDEFHKALIKKNFTTLADLSPKEFQKLKEEAVSPSLEKAFNTAMPNFEAEGAEEKVKKEDFIKHLASKNKDELQGFLNNGEESNNKIKEAFNKFELEKSKAGEKLKKLKEEIKDSLLKDCLEVLEKDTTKREEFFPVEVVVLQQEEDAENSAAEVIEMELDVPDSEVPDENPEVEEEKKLANFVKENADFFAKGLVEKYRKSKQDNKAEPNSVAKLIAENSGFCPSEVLENALTSALKKLNSKQRQQSASINSLPASQLENTNQQKRPRSASSGKVTSEEKRIEEDIKYFISSKLTKHIKQEVGKLKLLPLPLGMKDEVLEQIKAKPATYLKQEGKLNLEKILEIQIDQSEAVNEENLLRTLKTEIEKEIEPFKIADFITEGESDEGKQSFYQRIFESENENAMKKVLLAKIKESDNSILKKKIQGICKGLEDQVAKEVAEELLEDEENKNTEEKEEKEATFESLKKSLEGDSLKKPAMEKYIENHKDLANRKDLQEILKQDKNLTWAEDKSKSDKAITEALAEKIKEVETAIDNNATNVFDEQLKAGFAEKYKKFAPAEGDNIATIVEQPYLGKIFFKDGEAGSLETDAIKEEFGKKAKDFLATELFEGDEFAKFAEDIAMDNEELKETIKKGVDEFDFPEIVGEDGQGGNQKLTKEFLLKKFTEELKAKEETIFEALRGKKDANEEQGAKKAKQKIITALAEVNKILPDGNKIALTDLGTLEHEKHTVLYAMLQEKFKMQVDEKDVDPKTVLLDLFKGEGFEIDKEILENYLKDDVNKLNEYLANAIKFQKNNREEKQITLTDVLGGKGAVDTASLEYWKKKALNLAEPNTTYELKGPKTGRFGVKTMVLQKDTKLSFSGFFKKKPSEKQEVEMLQQFCHAHGKAKSSVVESESAESLFGAIQGAVNKAPKGKVTLTLNIAGKDREVEFGKMDKKNEFSVKVKNGAFPKGYAKLKEGKININPHVGGLTLTDFEEAKKQITKSEEQVTLLAKRLALVYLENNGIIEEYIHGNKDSKKITVNADRNGMKIDFGEDRLTRAGKTAKSLFGMNEQKIEEAIKKVLTEKLKGRIFKPEEYGAELSNDKKEEDVVNAKKSLWEEINISLTSPNTTSTVKIDDKKFTFKKEGGGFNVVFDNPLSSNANLEQKTLQFPTEDHFAYWDDHYLFSNITKDKIPELTKQEEAKKFFAEKVMETAKGLNDKSLSKKIHYFIDGKEQKLTLEVKNKRSTALRQFFKIGDSAAFLYVNGKKVCSNDELVLNELQKALSSQLGLSKKTLQLSDDFGKNDFITKMYKEEEMKKVEVEKASVAKGQPESKNKLGLGQGLSSQTTKVTETLANFRISGLENNYTKSNTQGRGKHVARLHDRRVVSCKELVDISNNSNNSRNY